MTEEVGAAATGNNYEGTTVVTRGPDDNGKDPVGAIFGAIESKAVREDPCLNKAKLTR